ncbi:MAG: hypothetical protein IJ682_07240 [Lachnospiraceae bacterium]|nr:hypothetical protein [Lachnospiraceae bacterium]
MSSFSVTNNHYLRVIYTGNTDVIKKADRENASSSKLSQADSTALRKAIARLADFDMDDVADDDDTKKTTFYNNVKAFSDAYNYTLESGSDSQNASISKLTKQMKQLSEKYADKMSDYGITFDDKGYMSVKNSAINNISTSKYKELIGKDSDYAKELSSLAKKISRHIDIAV